MLIPIAPPRFDVELDIAYATERNFTGKPLYKNPYCYLHPKAAECLGKAIVLAGKVGFRFRVFDGFRPKEVQVSLWDHTPDPHFISNPETGTVPHCRGVAVDLTLLGADQVPLDMGTAFDEFDVRSHHGNTDISQEAIRNRLLLMGIMTTAGWDFYRNEWWHYQLFQPREYPVLTDSEAKTKML